MVQTGGFPGKKSELLDYIHRRRQTHTSMHVTRTMPGHTQPTTGQVHLIEIVDSLRPRSGELLMKTERKSHRDEIKKGLDQVEGPWDISWGPSLC